MVTVRRAERQDAAGISHVHVQSWRTTYEGVVPEAFLASLDEKERIPQWQAWLARGISVFVAEIDGAIVGFAGGGAIREPFAPYDAELYTIYLLKGQQGFGIGRRLLDALTEDLLAKKYSSMLVWVLEQNTAVRFYENAGAQFLMSKQIEIGGAQLTELALGWLNLRSALSVSSSATERGR